MNLETQVLSLELSKRLNELGIKQKTLFTWQIGADEKPVLNISFMGEINSIDYSAFTAAELLQLLPYHITSQEPEPFNSYRLYISGSVIVKNPECIDPVRIHIVNYKTDTYDMNEPWANAHRYLIQNIWDENSANALAKTLVYLIENDLMTYG